MKTVLAALLLAGALLIGATPGGASVPRGPAGVVRHAGGFEALAATPRTATVSCGSISCSAYESGINRFFTDVAAASGATDNVYSVDTQYYDTIGGTHAIAYNSTFGGSSVDTGQYPTSGCDLHDGNPCLTDAQLQTEIKNDVAANNWSTGTSNLFFILTPANVDVCFDSAGTQCSTNYFCAYHDDFASGASQIVYGVEPFNATLAGCYESVLGQGAPNGVAIDASVNTLSHEMNEAITDPVPEVAPGWWSNDANEDEIGDLCAWGFGSPLGTIGGQPYNQVINGHDYSLQQEFSNAANAGHGGCVQSSSSPVATPPTSGRGPLVYQGGNVMRTNTVHVIYWIPGTVSVPTNSALPVVSGTAAVGKALATTTGGWNGSPTSFAYQWQQCSATGAACSDISGATASTYTLAPADAGHEIRSEVSARNAGGASAYAAAAPTEIVVPIPAVTVAPAVSGVAAVGKTLSTTQGTWNTAVSYAYQWLRCSATGSACASISHATSSTYTLKSADRGHELEARVAATNAAGTTLATSAPTAVVVGRPAASRPPHISGTARVGRRLSVTPGAWTDGLTLSYVWLRCNASGGACRRIAGATRASYRLTKRDVGHKLRVQEIAANVAGRSTASSPASPKIKS